MKKLICAALLLSSVAFAKEPKQEPQYVSPLYNPAAHLDEPERTGQFLFHPLSLFAATLDADLAFKVHDHVAITIPLYFNYNYVASLLVRLLSDGKESYNFIRFGTGIGARFFPTGMAFESGMVIEPYMKVGDAVINVQTASLSDDRHFLFLEGGAKIGYGWVFENGFSLNLDVAGFYSHTFGGFYGMEEEKASWVQKFRAASMGYGNGFGMLPELSMGYAW